MKITFLALHLGFGGVEKYIITIANILSEKHDVEIVSTYKTVENPSFMLDSKVKVIYLIDNKKPNKDSFRKAVKDKNFLKIMKEGVYSLQLLYLKKKRNIASIKNCKSDIIISTRDFHNELIQKYADKKIVKITSEHNHPCGNQKYIERVVNSCKGFDYMLPISKELTSFYSKKLVETKTKVVYIPFCIDEPTCKSIPDFINPVFISVGRLSKEKGLLDLIEVFSKIVKKKQNAYLHIVGDGPLKEDLLRKIESLHLMENVKIHGFLQKNEIDKLYCSSSVYLMTSYTESLGFVLLEAMACGLPCIAFNSAQGANEIIDDGNNGFLIPHRDQSLYVQKSIEIFEDKEQIKRMSINAKKCIEIYSYENTKNQWLQFMEFIK